MKKKNVKVNVFGSMWTIEFIDSPIEENDNFYWGMTYHETKRIVVAIKNSLGKNRPEHEVKVTLMHELMHCFLGEGSYWELNDNEQLVEWLAKCVTSIIEQNKLW